MFRSDDLFREMIYVIDNFSDHLLNTLMKCAEMGQQLQQGDQNEGQVKMAFAVINSILHIIESIISQEELPNFYEDNLPKITECCKFILSVEY
jgi:hypothetical protein